jgi:hypothetical protein
MNSEDSDEIRAAVIALHGLRSASVSSSTVSSPVHTSLSRSSTFDEPELYSPMTSLSDLHQLEMDKEQQEHFLDRVSQMPLVQGALRAYELGKNSSRVVKVSPKLWLPKSLK